MARFRFREVRLTGKGRPTRPWDQVEVEVEKRGQVKTPAEK